MRAPLKHTPRTVFRALAWRKERYSLYLLMARRKKKSCVAVFSRSQLSQRGWSPESVGKAPRVQRFHDCKEKWCRFARNKLFPLRSQLLFNYKPWRCHPLGAPRIAGDLAAQRTTRPADRHQPDLRLHKGARRTLEASVCTLLKLDDLSTGLAALRCCSSVIVHTSLHLSEVVRRQSPAAHTTHLILRGLSD